MSIRWNVFPIFVALMASATTAGAASIGYVGTVDGNLSPAQSYNSSGGANTVAITGVGSFVVTLPGLGNGTHSNVQVNAVNDDGQAHYCTANGWTSLNRTDVTANVDCFDAAGRPLSDDFTLFYQSRRSAPSQGAIAFLLENRADIIAVGSGHKPLRRYSFNSSGGSNYVTHQAKGEFVAFLPGLSPNGNPQVTAYGSAAARCEVSSWGAANQGTDVGIYCVDSTNAPADADFSLSYVVDATAASGPPATALGAYAWANNPTAKNYTPDKAHQFNAVSGEKLTAQYSKSAQVYTLTLPNPNNVTFNTYLVMVTATGANGEYCDAAGGVNVFTGELRQSFFCYDPVGIRINTPYVGMLMFSR